MAEQIYRKPEDYDLEHEGSTEDIEFFVRLATRFQPKRVLELACGSGRVTLPLAEAGSEQDFTVTGVELAPEMLEQARKRREESAPAIHDRLELVAGDMRTWEAETSFDLVVSPCSSMCHLLTLEDRLAAWQCARTNLVPGGRFVVDVSMPDLAAYMDSFMTPPRALIEIDRDTSDPASGIRLLRYKTTRYLAHRQTAQIRYLYDKFSAASSGDPPDRYLSDYESHVYFPEEMRLLFLHTGFRIESIYGDYRARSLGPASRQMIVVGVRE